jgi:hypothetical protein
MRARMVSAAAALVIAAGFAPAAVAEGIGKQRAASIAKRAASSRVERFGISYSPSAWKAACDSRSTGGGWRCEVGTNGQCSGVVAITGTNVRPRVRHVDVRCFG